MDLEHNNQAEANAGCDYLGVANDPNTRLLYPSPAGTCFALKRAAKIDIDYQQRYCLTGQHRSCPIYRQIAQGQSPANVKMEKGFWVEQTEQRRAGRGLAMLLLVLAIVLLGGAGVWALTRDSGDSVMAQFDGTAVAPTPTTASPLVAPAQKSTSESAALATPTAQSSPTPTPSATPTATLTATPTATATGTATATPTATMTPASTPTVDVTATPRSGWLVVPYATSTPTPRP